MFDADKTRIIELPYGEKNYDNMLSRETVFCVRHDRSRSDGIEWKSHWPCVPRWEWVNYDELVDIGIWIWLSLVQIAQLA